MPHDPDLGERVKVVRNLLLWIAERWDATIKPTVPICDDNGNVRMNSRETLGWYDQNTVYLPTSRIREAAGGALKETQIARVLDERGLLAKRDNGRLAVRYVPKVGKIQCYALTRAEFGYGADDEPKLKVHAGGLS